MVVSKFVKEDFTLNGSNERLIIGDITYANSYPDYLVIFVHGFKGFKDWGAHHLIAEAFAQAGIYFLKFNFSHSGVRHDYLSDITDLETFSKNTPTKQLFDLDRIITYAKQRFPHLKIVLLGHSLGGAISLLQAAKDKRVAKLITWAAISAFRNLWDKSDEPEWEQTGVRHISNARTGQHMPLSVQLLNDVLANEKAFDLNIAASTLSKPWLITHGTGDPAVEFNVAKNFHQLQPKSELLVFEKANHVFGASHPYTEKALPTDLQVFVERAIEFIKQ